MVTISIIIPAFNEEINLPKIIKNLREQITKNFKIIVIDNNSTDNTFQIAKKLADNVYKCKKQGISHARNYGVKMSKSDIVAFLDADSEPCKNWANMVEQSFNNNKNLTAITGLDLYDHKNFIKRGVINSYSRMCYISVKMSNSFGKPAIVGNNFAIKREVYNKIGGMDSVVVEDYYFSLKLRKLPNIKCICNSRMKVVLSSRRFDKIGIFNTIFLWSLAVLKRNSAKNYALKYE